MSDYERYPLTMVHPQHRSPDLVKGEAGHQDPHRHVGQFPPVVVRDQDQEDYHAAQGYQPAGRTDPAAWAKAHAEPPPPDYRPQEYPKYVLGQLVNTAVEEAAVLKAPPIEASPVSDDAEDLAAENARLKAEIEALKAEAAPKAPTPVQRRRKAPSAATLAALAKGRAKAAQNRKAAL